jgi:hypothetical protein
MKLRRISSLFLLASVLILSDLCCGQQLSPFAPAIPDWAVGPAKPVSLLLGFDVDPSLNRMSYNKFYDCDVDSFFPQAPCRYKTLMWTRSGDSVRLAVSLPIVACPRKRGFLYAGFAGYSRTPRPTKPDDWCDKDCPPSFADCSDVWQTANAAHIQQAMDGTQRWLASGDCGDTDKYDSNITDDSRISFITPEVLAVERVKAVITGGATYFTATEYDYESRLDTGSDLRLSDLLPPATINRVFRQSFQQQEFTPFRGEWEDLEKFDFAKRAGFTFVDVGGAIHLIGLHQAVGNAERTFLATLDLGVAPASLVKHADSGLDFSRVQKIDSKAVAVFTSPDRATIFVLTAERMIAIDTRSKRELFNVPHGLRFNKVIMAEWAEGKNTERWEKQLNSVASHIPPSISCPH